ncbi:hypothetical protein [Streptomyces europaeiscabiei]|uniref:hypothetical protein n=1 Tax=Streptomyces europaeiscabiei TaxID=146819 RepID=UPI0029A6D0AB|nr:hypothetical protein [Streptomyces europaeiscabiei]MDX2769463.1 hypothetical protein [Streptomyces europaeiscabiei]
MQTLTIIDLGVGFPLAVQVAKIVRHRTQRTTGKHSRETVYVITDLTSREASPKRIAKIVRSQWITENRLHFVRVSTFAQDASTVRTGHRPDNKATLRSFAINTLRAAGHEHRGRPPRDVLRQLPPTTGPPRTILTSTHAGSKDLATALADG